MPLQFSTRVRNARLDAIETTVGTSPIMRLRSGAPPANPAAADSGTVLATINLPSNWMNDASGGTKTIAGTWQDLSADATGTLGHFRVYDSGGSVCDLQGTITATGGGGDMQVDNVSVNAGQQITITSFTITEGNA